MRLSVGAARPVLAAERRRGRRLVDHYWPIVHNELHQRTRGDAALLDADRSAERSTSAAEHTDCVLAQSVNAQHARQWSCQLATWGGALRAYGKGRWHAGEARRHLATVSTSDGSSSHVVAGARSVRGSSSRRVIHAFTRRLRRLHALRSSAENPS